MRIVSPCQKLPKKVSNSFLIAFAILWIFFTSLNDKFLGVFTSFAYSLLEYCWVGCTVLLPNEEVAFRPFNKYCRNPKTTKEQLLANILLLPFIISAYFTVESFIIRIIIFPLVIWAIEIIEGYCLMMIYGYNPAWYYVGKDSYFHGNIKLGYYPLWLLTGILLEVLIKLTNYN